MALQVWLPLTNNLENKGCSAAVATNNGATINSSGKIGQCYSFDGTNDIITISNAGSIINGGSKPFSFAMWVYNNENGTRGGLLSTYDGTSTNMSFEINSGSVSSNKFRFWWNGEVDFYEGTLTYQKWTHLTVTYNGNLISVYTNGVLSGTKTATLTNLNKSTFYIGNDVRSGGNPFNGKFNDVRIYDHCLSQQEVREISKGLVLHYPLDNISGISGNPNLLSGSINKIGAWTAEGLTREQASDVEFANCIKVTTTAENKRMYTSTSNVWTSGNKYTVSFYAKATTDGIVCNMSRSIANFTSNFTLTTEWKKYTGVITSSETASGGTLSFRIVSSTATVYIANVKLEAGETATEWCPNTTDEEYSKLGYNTGKIEDVSGFGNDLMIQGTFSFDASTTRYDCSAGLNGSACSTGASYVTELSNRVQGKTISFWYKPNLLVADTSLRGVWIAYAQTADASTSAWLCYNAMKNTMNLINTMDQATQISGLGAWAHCCWVLGATSYTLYKNGTSLGTWTYSSEGRTSVFGSSETYFYRLFYGCGWGTPVEKSISSYSDFRIYATALSAEDIKLLYNRGASIDNAGNLHCGELVEDNTATKQQVKKNTQVKSRYFSELPLKYDDTIYVEPDGSMWVRIVRQNAPGTVANNFASTDSFTTSVYKNVNTWFYGVMCNYVNKWEFMCKQKAQTANNETKFRWVQSVNPMTADMAAIAAATVTKNTSSGYTATGSGYTGIYAKKSTSYITTYQPSATNNTWGRFGQWQQFQSGLAGTNGVTVTTGYSDLYLRIDNVTFVNLPANTKTQFLKSGDINSTEIYEQ